MQEKIFAIGDIHGSIDRLERLLDRLPFVAGRDTLVFLGDFLDRGPGSRQVLDLLCRLQVQENMRLVALMGNHEYLLLEYHRTGDPVLLPYLRRMGIEQTMESYGRSSLAELRDLTFMPAAHRDFLNSLIPYWQTPDYIFVHAGLRYDEPLAEQHITDLCEVREQFLVEERDFGKRIIFGHTAFLTPLVTPNKIGIDTGASQGNMLTAVQLPDEIFYHA